MQKGEKHMTESEAQLAQLIEQERKAFVAAQYARLQDAMGMPYDENGQRRIFHPLAQDETGQPLPGRPEELTLAELAMLPHLAAELPRFGTVSVMPLFRTAPEDARRLELLAGVSDALLSGKPVREEQRQALLQGHAAFMQENRQDDGVVVILR